MLRLTYFCLFLFLATRITYGQRNKECTCKLPNEPNYASNINLIHYDCNNGYSTAYPITHPEGLLNVLNGNKRTIFYTFGFTQYPNHDNVKKIIRALCHGNTDNVVLLDWSKYSKTDDLSQYKKVLQNAQKVGSLFGHSLKQLVNAGLNSNQIYLIGHSLGAHISGLGGKCSKSMFKIPRITGLDPANRDKYPDGCYLTPTDALWVDVIHTDAGGLGTAESLGTVEYYANNGTALQPDCKCEVFKTKKDEIFCSHQHSVDYYADTKLYPNKYIAVQCPSGDMFTSNECNNNRKTGVGYAASNVHGKYYFKPEDICNSG